ncbi:phosphoribosyl-AMP cyclohydrolase [Flexithrix dorotheae]|uniref:phosphoribosyl-AMP cyclohydrolase n=1 Tax=Flexithrix dorotheae TaxID=70993 RepID=UPI00037D6F59|nr:phosphoribosyl-AMP cyclohydrolase [Flexithrix dorotheae]
MGNAELEKNTQLNVQFAKRGGLVPVIVQDVDSMEILMLGYANEKAFEETLKTNKATFWSTSRKEIWTKGKTSGDFLEVQEILIDCDQDALIYKVKKIGLGACHTKNSNGETRPSCFYRKLDENKELSFLKGQE